MDLIKNIAALTKECAEIRKMTADGDEFTAKTLKLMEDALKTMHSQLRYALDGNGDERH